MVVAQFDENESGSWFFCRFQRCWCHGLVFFFLVIGVMIRFRRYDRLGNVHYRDSIYSNTRTRNVVPFTAKRDSENIIDCKTRHVTWFLNDVWFTLSIVYYWLQNAIRFLWENIRSWCAICVCLQRESEHGVTQELGLQSRALHKSDISGQYMWPVQEHIRRPESLVPIEYWVAHELYFSRTTW